MNHPKRNSELDRYKVKVRQRLNELTDVLARISVGDISGDLKLSKVEDEFTDLYVGIQLILEVFREHLEYFRAVNQGLVKDIRLAKASSDVVEQEKVIDEAILDSIGEGLVVTDTQGKVIEINRHAEELLRLTGREIVGKQFFNSIQARDSQDVVLTEEELPIKLSLTRRQRVTHRNLLFSTKRVKNLPVTVISSPIFLGRTLLGAVSVFRDIREEQEIDKAKTEVISFTSHQLRTPLSVINWYSEVLLKEHLGPLTKPQREYTEVILFTARRMIELVNTFLKVSRIQLGKLVVDVKPISLHAIIKSISKELELQVSQRDLHFVMNFSKETPRLLGDERLIRVVFQNLIGNAVKYTPKGGYVSVETSAIKPADKLPVAEGVLVVIRDTGYGIPKKQQDRIFTKLFRAENAQQVDTEGAGLGLYMVRSILNYIGGDAWFRSRLNRGTVFFVALPKKPILPPKSS